MRKPPAHPLVLAILVLAAPLAARAGVVHVRDGSSLAGPVERIDGSRLRVHTLERPVDVDASDVVHLEDDAMLQRMLRAATDRLDRSDASATMCLATWALRKGLHDEALDLADAARRIGSAQGRESSLPEGLMHVTVLDVGRDGPLDDRAAWRLLEAAGDERRPATAEVALARLKDLAARNDVTRALNKALRADEPDVRSLALQVVAAHTPPELWRRSVSHLLLDRDAGVRAAALDAVRAYAEPGVLVPIAHALRTGDAPLRSAALDAVDGLEEVRATGLLITLLREPASGAPVFTGSIANVEQRTFVSTFDVDVANSAFIANPEIGVLQSGGVLDTAVLASSTHRRLLPAERTRVLGLLQRFTGQELGDDFNAWKDWHEASRP